MRGGWIHRLLFAAVLTVAVAKAEEFESLADLSFTRPSDVDDWQTREGSQWKLTPDKGLYQLIKPGEQGEFRRPLSWSVWRGRKVGACEVSVRARCLTPTNVKGRDVLIIFGFQDPDHFYYVHFSAENAKVHNILAKVDGGERTPLPLKGERTPRLLEEGFQSLKLRHDPETGEIAAWVDEKPVLQAVDKTFRGGFVGVGSFDDTVDFDRFSLRGTALLPSSP
jgi:hypothetical protein